MAHIIASDKQRGLINSGNKLDKHTQDIVAYAKNEMAHAVYVDDKQIDPTDSLKQLGRYYVSSDFERRLASLLPSNCAFIDNPYRAGFRALIRLHPISPVFPSGYETISAFERGIIPEHSVLQLKNVDVPDPDVLARRVTVRRADLPKHKYKPGEGFIFDDTVVRPGFKRTKQLGHEIKRGWRTVLLYGLKAGLFNLTEIERVFGSKDHPSWSQHTGKREMLLPW